MLHWQTCLRQLLVPGGVLFALALALWRLRVAETQGLASLAALLGLAVLVAVALGWRFHLTRIAMAAALTALGAWMLVSCAAPDRACLLQLLLFAAPINYLLLLVVHEVGFDLESLAWWAGLLALECVIAVILSRSANVEVLRWLTSPLFASRWLAWLTPTVLATMIGLLGLAISAVLARRAAEVSLFWATAAMLLALRQPSIAALGLALFAALILAAGVLEAAYLVAFHDELTSLPSRRAYNRAASRLRLGYSVAIVDIDFFKRFNDTYGHDVGDDVLRMVAGRLAEVTGGGRAYRCGGEEFNILFPDLDAPSAARHAELLRQEIEQTPFIVRGQDRSNRKRPERRSFFTRVAAPERGQTVHVTVSIGVAQQRSDAPFEAVAKQADQALYLSKESGRNQVTIFKKGAKPSTEAPAPTEGEPFR